MKLLVPLFGSTVSLHGATHLSAEQRARLTTQLTAALEAHHRITPQSRRLTQGKA